MNTHDGMSQVIKDYYQTIFKASPEVRMGEGVAQARVSREKNDKLVQDISFEEFTVAVKQMHPDKASSPDGLNPAFFQHFWESMGKEVYECCKVWLSTCSFPDDINNTNLVLIPKKANPSNMKDFRPIALCNVLYKILAKVLANQLKVLLPDLISENQSAFVLRRCITENVLVAFEVLHHMKRSKTGQHGEVALKLDNSKAYDRVDWNFLRQRMRSMGFCRTWNNWIMMCVRMVSYEVCFNGSSIGPIIPEQGIRQGDPFSPYLFLLCAEGFSDSINIAATNGVINGCKISATTPVITHLLFVDDSFLFFRADTIEANAVKDLLNAYEQQSRQSVNFQKYGVFFSSNVRLDKQRELLEILGVTKALEDIKYLSLPSLVGRSKKKVFGFIKDRVWQRIQRWKVISGFYIHLEAFVLT